MLEAQKLARRHSLSTIGRKYLGRPIFPRLDIIWTNGVAKGAKVLCGRQVRELGFSSDSRFKATEDFSALVLVPNKSCHEASAEHLQRNRPLQSLPPGGNTGARPLR